MCWKPSQYVLDFAFLLELCDYLDAFVMLSLFVCVVISRQCAWIVVLTMRRYAALLSFRHTLGHRSTHACVHRHLGLLWMLQLIQLRVVLMFALMAANP
jgi:hypothetical protein